LPFSDSYGVNYFKVTKFSKQDDTARRQGKEINMKKYNGGLSLVELVIAMAIMMIIMAAIMPQFRAIQNSWASSEASANMIQNGRVLEEHIIRNLSSAKQLVNVSSSSDSNGFVIFKDAADIQKRYMVSGGYVVFGTLGSEEQLAGPVSRFQVSCYSLDDFNTPTTDANTIRLVEVETDFTNSNPMGTDRTFIASAYLRANANIGCDLVGWWKLDETSGITAADSSGNGNNGTLSSNPVWVAGQIGNGLDFDGYNDYASLPIGSVINSLTNCTITTWVNWNGSSSWQRIWDFGTGETRYMFLTPNNGNTGRPRFAITDNTYSNEDQTTAPSTLSTDVWHHIAVTIDADNHTHKMYIDGSYVAQNTFGYLTPSDLGATNHNYLARSQFAADPYFNGTLDDVRIYDRVLTAAEIAQLASTLRYQPTHTENKDASDLTSLAVSIPAGYSAGDLLIAAVATDGDTSTTITTAAAGWTRIDRGASSSAVTLGAWYKVAGASESAPTFTWTGGQQAYGWMMRFTGQDSSDPIDDYAAGNYTSSTPTSPSVTTAADNSIILRLGAFDDDDITIDNSALLSGHTTITADESASSVTGSPPTYQAAGALTSSAGQTTVSWPTHQSGDVAFLIIESANQTISLATAAGFAQVTNSPQGTGTAGGTAATRLAVYWKRAATSSEASPVVADSGNHQVARIITFRGVIASGNPWDITAGNTASSASTSVSIPGATTTVANTLVLEIVAYGTDTTTAQASGWTNANLASLTERIDNGTTNNNGGGFAAATGVKATAGAYGTTTATLATSSVQGRMSIALKSDASGTGGTVSGGAGYVKQSTAGSSGTSNFTLGSSNEARTLTIAIAPDSTSNDDCSGEITP